MRKTKLSEFDMRVVINGLCQTRMNYCAEKREAVDEIILLSSSFTYLPLFNVDIQESAQVKEPEMRYI